MTEKNILPPMDAWTASSLLQKAIRRGEVEYSQAAASAFYRMRGSAIWRRLSLIAFEDIGPADPDLCIMVMQHTSSSKKNADTGVILSLVERMAKAVKSREADYLICAAKQAPFVEDQRRAMAALTVSERIALAVCRKSLLTDQALAAWMASGVNGGGQQVLGAGDLHGLLATFVESGISSEFAASTGAAARKTSEPITIMASLILLTILRHQEVPDVVSEPLPPSVDCNGIPSWVFDKHTRVGKAAVRQLISESRVVRECLADFVPEFRAMEVASMAAFYADAIAVNRRLNWSQSDTLYRLGLRTDMRKIGTPEAGILPIVHTVRSNLDHLNDIRRRLRTSSRAPHAVQSKFEGIDQ